MNEQEINKKIKLTLVGITISWIIIFISIILAIFINWQFIFGWLICALYTRGNFYKIFWLTQIRSKNEQ